MIYQICTRTIHELFEADIINALDAVAFNGLVTNKNPATGIEETKAVPYTTDASFMTDLKTPTAIFGPGNASQCHKPNEYVEIADVEKAKHFYKNIIKTFLF